VGRANFVHEIVTMAHDKKHHDVTYENVDAQLTRLEQRGVAAVVRDIQQTIRKLRRDAPDQFNLAALGRAQFDYCSDLNWMIRQTEAAVSIACGIAILEPTPAGEAACGAITLALGLLYAQRSWWC
jgi:hypothetical protein